jgi:hypothetical protein
LEVQSYSLLGDLTAVLFWKEVSLKNNDMEQEYLFQNTLHNKVHLH